MNFKNATGILFAVTLGLGLTACSKEEASAPPMQDEVIVEEIVEMEAADGSEVVVDVVIEEDAEDMAEDMMEAMEEEAAAAEEEMPAE
jgi:hypothetical protein